MGIRHQPKRASGFAEIHNQCVTWAAFAVSFVILVACVVFGLGQGG